MEGAVQEMEDQVRLSFISSTIHQKFIPIWGTKLKAALGHLIPVCFIYFLHSFLSPFVFEEEYSKVTGSKFRPKASVLPPSPSQEEAQAVNPLDVKPGVQVFASFVCGEVFYSNSPR